MLTPFAIKERFARLIELFESDPKLANAALRKLIPDKLKCFSLAENSGRNGNQYSKGWRIEGNVSLGVENSEDISLDSSSIKFSIII